MIARVRKSLGRVLGALLVMSGGALLVAGALLKAIAPTPVLEGAEPAPVSGVQAYSSALVQDVLYGAFVHWDAGKVQGVRDLGVGIVGQLPPSEAAAQVLVGDQVSYMDWLLHCREAMDDAPDVVAAGGFGAVQDSLMLEVSSCRDDLLVLLQNVKSHAAQFPGYGYATVPRFGEWDQTAFIAVRQLDSRAAVAIDDVSAHSTFFSGSPAKDFPSLGAVQAFLASKTIGAPQASASSEGVVLFADKVDAASAVGFWLRHAQALGKSEVRLEFRQSGSETRVCAAASGEVYCPLGSGFLVLAVHPEDAPYNQHGVSVFSGANPEDVQEWGLLIRNAASQESGNLTVQVSCLGEPPVQWVLPSVPAETTVFTSHPFDEGVTCPAVLEVRNEAGVLLARVGEIAGELGFTV